MDPKNEIKVTVTFGKDKTTIEARDTDTVGTIKTIAFRELRVVQDPAYDYFLNFKGENLNDETKTIAEAVGHHPANHIHLSVEKIPKGG